MNWDDFFIAQALLVSTKSKDPSTKVGCVIVSPDHVVLSQGFNGFPRGVIEVSDDPTFDRWDRPQKYSWVEHAERNAVYNAARHGIKLLGSRAYLNWSPNPCADCARALIQAGVIEVIGTDKAFAGKGAGVHYHVDFAETMFKEANVKIRVVEGYN